MRIDAPIFTGSFSLNGSTLQNLSAVSTTGSNTFVGNQNVQGFLSNFVNKLVIFNIFKTFGNGPMGRIEGYLCLVYLCGPDHLRNNYKRV